MIQRIPQSIWLLIAVLLGISLGIGLGQDQWNFFGVIFGWYYFFLGIVQLLLGLSSHEGLQVQWFAWQLSWIYPLALLAYAVCALWTIRSPRSTHNGLTVTVVGAFVSTLASIPSAIVTMSINGHVNFFSTLFYY